MSTGDEILERLYQAFNARDVGAALSMMQPDVVWANGIDGGYVEGRNAVEEYWARQWSEMNSFAEPVAIDRQSSDRASAEVRLTAYDLEGRKLFDTRATHVFEFKDGLIQRFDIVAD